ncbi:MAG: amidohydrolase family protein [Eubacteriales bacterium]|nr:amidohydrolase family protein [Eubacteriales bacterium]
MKYRGKIIDSHHHMVGGYGEGLAFYELYQKLLENGGLSAMNVVMIPQWGEEYITQNEQAILFKILYPGKFYTYAGFDYYMPKGKNRKDFEAQARQYIDMGFDGIKMVELKPMVYKQLGCPVLSSEAYEGMWRFMENGGHPVLLHMGDPETYWDISRCTKMDLENGWFCGDGTYPQLEEFYADVEKVLDKHPGLNVSLAHFYFLSAQLERAARFLDKHPCVRFDITPGREMYENFSMRADEWRDFSIRYQDRILYGTDNGWSRGLHNGKRQEDRALVKFFCACALYIADEDGQHDAKNQVDDNKGHVINQGI